MSEVVEAIYEFHPQGNDDMELKPGNHIEVHEHLSPDWARGKNLDTGKEGVFPTNYVKPASSGEKGFSRPAAAVPQGAPQGFDEKSSYNPPNAAWQQQQPPQYQQYQPPQQYQQPQQQQPPQQYQQPQQQAQPQQAHHHNHMFGNIARQFGQSMVFGAGATAGSDIINKIF